MDEQLRHEAERALEALDTAQSAFRRSAWRHAVDKFTQNHPTATLVVAAKFSAGDESIPIALYDARGDLVADLDPDDFLFGVREASLDHERMLLDARSQPHDAVVQRAIFDAMVRRAENDEEAVHIRDLRTVYLSDVQEFLAGDSPNEISLRRKQQSGMDDWRREMTPRAWVEARPVAVMAGIDGHGDHHGVVFPGEPSGHVHPTVWVTKRTLRYLNNEANHGEPDHEAAGERRLEAALIPPTMNVRVVHDELAGLGYDQGLALYAVPSSLPIVIRGYHQPADHAPPTTTVEGATPFTVDAPGPDM